MIARSYKIKSSFFFVVCLSAYGMLIINLYSIQVSHVAFFSHLGAQQYTTTVTQAPPRAYIYDRYGKPIALNKTTKSAFMLPQKMEALESLKPFLKKEFPAAYERLQHTTTKHFMYVKRRLTQSDTDKIIKAQLPDIFFLDEPSRFYPIPCACPVVGMTDIDTIGLFGIEYRYNTLLTGLPTSYLLQKDARSGNFYFEKSVSTQGTQGTPITLTLDSSLQFLVTEEMSATLNEFGIQEGCAIIMDPHTGEIYAMVTIPFCDPNKPEQTTLEDIKNRAIVDTYERGSVFKVFSTLAALAEGAVTPEELIDCKNAKTAYVEGRKINTVYPRGIIPFKEVVASSNNIGIATVSMRIGKQLYEHYTRLGFGVPTGIELPGEQAGYVNPPHNWSKQSAISLSYGYEINCTLLQLARAFSIIANGGYAVQPHILLNHGLPHIPPKQLYDPLTIAMIQEILAYASRNSIKRLDIPDDVTVLGKTGTAELLENGHYQRDRNIYSYVGMVKKGSYNRVIALFVRESPQKKLYASMVTLPLFERLVHILMLHDRIQ